MALARKAGFEVHGRVGEGKRWRTICDVAEEPNAEPIVVEVEPAQGGHWLA